MKHTKEQINMISESQLIDAMQIYGGDFLKAFAAAYIKADLSNRQLLKPVIDKYRDELEGFVISKGISI